MPPLALDQYLQVRVLTYFLLLTRVTGLLSFGPVFSSRALPVPFRFYLAFGISLLLVSVMPSPPVEPRTLVELVVFFFGELLVGFVLGGFLQMVLQSLQLAGQAAGQQLGLALANVLNPQFDDQVSTTAVVYVTVASLIFFGIGAHREMFAALLETFDAIPLGQVYMTTSVPELAMDMLRHSMVFAVRVAAPVTVALLLTEVALGLVGRTVPQMNILSVGFGLRLIVGLLVTAASVEGAMNLVPDYLQTGFTLAYEALASMVPD